MVTICNAQIMFFLVNARLSSIFWTYLPLSKVHKSILSLYVVWKIYSSASESTYWVASTDLRQFGNDLNRRLINLKTNFFINRYFEFIYIFIEFEISMDLKFPCDKHLVWQHSGLFQQKQIEVINLLKVINFSLKNALIIIIIQICILEITWINSSI